MREDLLTKRKLEVNIDLPLFHRIMALFCSNRPSLICRRKQKGKCN